MTPLKGELRAVPEWEKAVTWVESYLKDAGIAPYFGYGYRDSFSSGDIHTYNVVGIIPAAEPTDRFVILSAHLDHLGTVAGEPGTDHIFNGANDNASGVAAVLSIASGLKDTRLQYNLLVVLFLR
ncbi:MAG: M28 family peptidase [Taibaiella sp.]|nr:M28 family peptidase [Taibaiella sp.]